MDRSGLRGLLVSTAGLLLCLSPVVSRTACAAAPIVAPIVVVRDVTMPTGRGFQLPLNGSGSGGVPLKYSVVSVSNTNLIAQLSPSTNRSLWLEVSGVDSGGTNFTGDLVLQLFEDLTPVTTARIIDLVNSDFYNNLTFHRVVSNFVAQGGDPNGNGTGGSGVKFDDEFVARLTFDGFGQLAMANSGPDSNDSQFFITDGDFSLADPSNQPPQFLDFSYTLFGQMTSGFDVLEKIMSTPVNSTNDRPITPVVIVSATVFTNQEDAVLRLYATPGFTGTVAVTVGALATSRVSTQMTVQVTVVPDTVIEKPFLGPVPNLVTTENTPASFPFTYTDLSDVGPQLGLFDAYNWDTNGTAVFPPNVIGTLSNGWFTCSPTSNFTGVATMVMVLYVLPNQGGQPTQIDTQHFSLTVYPDTLTVVPTKGTLQDVPKAHGSKVSISGTLAFPAQSGNTFNPATDALQLSIGDPRYPLQVTAPAGDHGWSGRNGKFAWKSPKTFPGKVSLRLDMVKGSFAITASGFNFPGVQSGLVHLNLFLGNNYGTAERIWTATANKPGSFVLPSGP